MLDLDQKSLQRMAQGLKRVLVVDSQPAGYRMLADLLRSITPSHVCHSATAAEAMTLAVTFDPQVVFVTHGGGVDGAALTKELRRSYLNCRKAPVIMIMIEPTAQSIVAARDSGVHEFLVRPFTMKDLLRRLEAVTLKARDWVEAVEYVGPDRRRFNSGEYKGPQKRKAGGDGDKGRIEQALRIVVSAAKALESDPAQARRALAAQVEILRICAAKTQNIALAQATAGLARCLTMESLTLQSLGPAVTALAAFLPQDAKAA